MGKTVNLVIRPSGRIVFVYDDAVADACRGIGKMTTVRASHVEPDGDTWTVDLRPSGGPVVPGFATRAAGLAYEIDWLNKNWLGIN